MEKKGKGLQTAGIIFITLQVMSYTQLDVNSLFAPNNSTYDDFTYVLGKIAFFIGYSILGLIGIGLLLAYKKKNSPSNQNNNEKKNDTPREQKRLYKCSNCGETFEYDFDVCPNCKYDFSKGIVEEQKDEENTFVCSNCGEVISGDENECPNCGEVFEDDELLKEDKKSKEKKSTRTNMDKKYSDLNKLKKMLDKDIITKEEFEKEKKKILDK